MFLLLVHNQANFTCGYGP